MQGLRQAADVIVEILREILGNDHLVEGAGAAVGLALTGDQPAQDLGDGDRVTEAQRRRQGLRERADVDHLLRVHRIEGRRAGPVPGQVSVAFVLEHRNPVLARQRQQRLAALARQDRTSRVLHGRNRIDVFWADPFAPEILNDAGETVDRQALVVKRRADDVDAQPLQFGQGAAIGELFEDDGVAMLEQQAVDEVDRLPGARRDQHVVGCAFDRRPLGNLVDHELTQSEVPLRAVEVVERQIGPAAA